MPTLYRKYRPQKFSDVVGQDHIVRTLTNEITAGQIAHAYLFSGPRGTGKTTTARLLAKAANCQERQEGGFEPCDKCSSCQEISAGRNIDVIEIDAASQTGIDSVRENVIENARFKPTKSKYKVFIIDEVHMLSSNAFNALLKTLEEPPTHVILILATTELHKLPATVVSRCQKFNFKKIPYETMLGRLANICEEEGIKTDKEVLKRIINKSDGCLRDAESLLGQIFSLNLKKIGAEDIDIILPASDMAAVLNFVNYITNGQTAAALELLNSLTNEGANLEQFADDLLETLRLTMIAQTAPINNFHTNYSEDSLKKIKKMAGEFNPARLTALIDKTMIRRFQIKNAPIPQLPLELLTVEFSAPLEKTKDDEPGEPPAGDNPPSAERIEKKDGEEEPGGGVVASTRKIGGSIKNAISGLTTRKREFKTTLDDINKRWPEVIDKLSKNNHSLIFILKMCSPRKIDENGLHLGIPYALHKDKIEEQKNKRIIEKCLNELLAEKINIVCDLVTGKENKTETADNDLKSLAAEFGGEVV